MAGSCRLSPLDIRRPGDPQRRTLRWYSTGSKNCERGCPPSKQGDELPAEPHRRESRRVMNMRGVAHAQDCGSHGDEHPTPGFTRLPSRPEWIDMNVTSSAT